MRFCGIKNKSKIKLIAKLKVSLLVNALLFPYLLASKSSSNLLVVAQMRDGEVSTGE